MNLLLIVIVLALITAMLVAAGRYAMQHFHGTFTAWGARHFSDQSGTAPTRRDRRR